MVTEAQKKAFIDALNTICNKSILHSKKNFTKYDRWLKNFYYRYNNNTMPEEHIQMFKSRLNNYHITFEEFLETKGNLKVFVQLCAERKNENSLNAHIEKAVEEFKKEFTIEFIENQKKYRELQKAYLLKLLVEEDNISLENIKSKLEKEGIPLIGLDNSLSELRNEVPGIIRSISTDGLKKIYSISGTATNRQEALQSSEICPRISDILDGTIQFLVTADFHLSPRLYKGQIKKIYEPFFDFSSTHDNIPIIDLGDVMDSLRYIKFKDWSPMNKEAVDSSYKFYKNYSEAISSEKDIRLYQLLGNHDLHSYTVGVDPVEIINDYSDNIVFLGNDKGSVMLGNDKIGLFHTIGNFQKGACIDYSSICEELSKYVNEYIYSLVGHVHRGYHDPYNHFTSVNNGYNKALLFTAEIKKGTVKRMNAEELLLDNKNKLNSSNSYSIEIYNSDYQLKKKKSQ